MAFAALIPIITSALSAMQQQNKDNDENTEKKGIMSLEPENKDTNWSGFSLPSDNNPLASSYEKAMKVWQASKKNQEDQNGLS